MRKLILATLAAAVALPATVATPAFAQSAREVRESQRDLRQEQRELRDAQRYGTRRDVRDQRRDVREARQELREDWRDYRRTHRDLYRGAGWRAPFRYQTWNRGARISANYYGPRYVIADPYRYRLPAASGPNRWVRHYNDVLLVNTRTGVVVDVIRGFYW